MFCWIRKFLFLSVVALCSCFIACDSYYHGSNFKNLDDEFGIAPAETTLTDTVLKNFEVSGNFGLASQLIPEKLEVSAVDASMKKISTRSAKIMRDRTDFSFWVEEQEYPVRVARFKFTCAYPYPNDSMKMEFVSYLPVESRQSVNLDIFSALLSTRIEKIVKEEGRSFAEADGIATRELNQLLEIKNYNKYGVENYRADKDTLKPLVYLYGRIFLQDTTFYSAFKKMKKAVGGSKRWSDLFSPVQIADSLVRYYRIKEIDYRRSVYPYLRKDPDFNVAVHQTVFRVVEYAYGMPRCKSEGITFRNAVKKSKFVDYDFICDRDSNEYFWRGDGELDDTSTTVTDPKDRTFEEIAEDLFGRCFVATENKKAHSGDTLFAECKDGKWVPMEEVDYYEGRCSDNRQKTKVVTPSKKIYQCLDHVWVPISVPAYYGDSCNARGKVVIRDDTYFICDGEWMALGDSAQSDPADSLGACADTVFVETYEGSFFMCDSGNWSRISPEILMPEQKDGHLCTVDSIGIVQVHNDTIYECSYPAIGHIPSWHINSKKTVSEERKKQNQTYGDVCKKGSKGTSFVWSETSKRYMGCNAESHSWVYIYFNDYYYANPLFDNGELKNGSFISDSVYQVEIQGVRYKFAYQGKRSDEDYYRLTGAERDGVAYKAAIWRKNLFLSPVDGTESKALSQVENRTESVDAYLERRSESLLYPMRDVTFSYWSESAYMDYASASAFCPEGFHLPDTTAWPAMERELYVSFDRYVNTCPYKVYIDGVQRSITMLWTSVEKDASTQYCLERIYVSANKEEVNVVECPKDMYPMVQPLCIMDGQEVENAQ